MMAGREQKPCRWRLQSGFLMSLVIDEWGGKAMGLADTGLQDNIGVARLLFYRSGSMT